ncbi:MAG: hypothetical protein ACKOI2_00785 [Actinomycetota bacterium]
MARDSLSRFLCRAVLIAGVLAGTSVTQVGAQDQAPPCPEYVIEGTIGASDSGPEGARTASAYVHLSGTPVVNHQVIATFSDAAGAAIGEPSVLVTDAGGRTHVTVPESAESVNFVAESTNVPGCSGEESPDPRVLLEIVPTGLSDGSSPEGPVNGEPEEILAKTGPVSDAIALASLLLLAFGAAVGTGRGRRRALAGGGAKRRFPR